MPGKFPFTSLTLYWYVPALLNVISPKLNIPSALLLVTVLFGKGAFGVTAWILNWYCPSSTGSSTPVISFTQTFLPVKYVSPLNMKGSTLYSLTNAISWTGCPSALTVFVTS